jgi:WD40 repeat protein
VPHPSLDEILRGTPAVTEHLASCASCRALAAVAEVPFPADLVDRSRYIDWQTLGAGGGGMGRTFQARDRRLGRDVVIKQPLASDQGFDLRTRFEREALLTARLQHPSIVGVYEAGRFPDGEPFFAMPHVRGAPLSDEIARRSTLEQRLALLGNVTAACEAVAYAHEQGIVHRDIKPANILIGSFGETVLIDWGLATDMKSAAGAADAPVTEIGDGLTQLGVGTAQYMPPEQARGGAPDARMDVYALGATLYHALAGTPPYGSGDSGEARNRLLAQPPQPLSKLAPQVPPALCDIVARAMSRDPMERFETASALAAELRRFQTGQLVQSRRYGPGEILRHFARRYRAPLIVAGVAAVVLAVAAIVSAVRIAKASRGAAVAQQRAEENERKSQRELRRGLGVSASRLALVPTRRLDALALAVDAVAPELAAGHAPAREALQGLYDAIAAGPPAVVLDANTTVIRRFAFSADGALLATVSPGEHAVHVWDGRTGRLVGTAAAGGAHFSVRDLRFSPDNHWLLTWGHDPAQAQLWPVGSGQAITLSLDGAIAGADFLADGRIVVAGTGLAFLSRDGVEQRRLALPAPATRLAVAAGRIAASTSGGDVIVWDAAGTQLVALRTQAVSMLALSSDGKRLAIASSELVEVRELDAVPPGAAAQPIARVTLGTPPSASATLTFAEAGRFVVVSDPDRSSAVIDLAKDPTATAIDQTWLADDASWTGRPGRLERMDLEALAPMRAMEGPPGLGLEALAVAPGKRVAVATERAAWLVDARGDATGLLGHTSEVSAIATVGRSIVSAGLDGRLRTWDEQGAPSSAVLGSEALVMAAVGTKVVVGDAGGKVAVVDTAGSSRAPREVASAGALVSALQASPDARSAVVARADGEVFCVDVASSGTAVQWQARGEPAANTVALRADGTWAATGHIDGSIRLWRLAASPSSSCSAATLAGTTSIPDRDNAGRARYVLAFDRMGRLLASRFGSDTKVFSVPSLAEHGSLDGRLVAVSRDAMRAATLASDGELVLFADTAQSSSTRVATSRRPIVAATFSPDGRTLVTGDVDGTIRAIDIEKIVAGDVDATLEIPASGAGTVSALAYSPEDNAIIAGHVTGALRSHPLTAEAALARACRTLAEFGREVPGCATAK